MAYSVYGDVASEFKNILFATGQPVTDAEVTEFISQADAEIDGYLSQRYVTPITGTISLVVVKQLSIWLVADRVSKILQVKTKTEETKTADKSLRQMALDRLKELAKGTFKLPDATVLSSGAGFRSYANDNELDYTFKKGDDQW
jgi:phage gp36-like protein